MELTKTLVEDELYCVNGYLIKSAHKDNWFNILKNDFSIWVDSKMFENHSARCWPLLRSCATHLFTPEGATTGTPTGGWVSLPAYSWSRMRGTVGVRRTPWLRNLILCSRNLRPSDRKKWWLSKIRAQKEVSLKVLFISNIWTWASEKLKM